ncbi:MAG: ABC transporter ATP-binding protein [Pseudomonadota bacterium]
MIDVTDISKSFSGMRAVENCSLRIETGKITGVIGPNGAGKTTLFNMIAGTMKPDSGQIVLDGKDVTGWPPHRLYDEGLVRTFQIPREFSQMTVVENLMVAAPDQPGDELWRALFQRRRVADFDKATRERAEEVLDFLQIQKLRNQLAGQLSGGQKKLIEIGRTMMTEAKVALLDEPGAGVNRTLLVKICDTIMRLNKERGYTICIIEHDMDVITRLSDTVIVMAEGKVLMQGSMDEVRADKDVIDAYLGGAS